MKRLLSQSLLALLLVALPLVTVQGQNTAARPDRGLTTGAAYSVSDINKISLTNGNVNINIPLAGLPPMAGGKLSWTVIAHYNSKLWNVTRNQEAHVDSQAQPYVVSTPQLSDLGGWRIGGTYSIDIRSAYEDFNYLIPPPVGGIPEWERELMMQGWYKVVLRSPDGSERELRPTGSTSYWGSQDFLRGYFNVLPNGSSFIKYYSFDSTFITALIKSEFEWTIFMADGTQVVRTPDGIQRIKDTNGNSIKDLHGQQRDALPGRAHGPGDSSYL